jgi:hypothetical protein
LIDSLALVLLSFNIIHIYPGAVLLGLVLMLSANEIRRRYGSLWQARITWAMARAIVPAMFLLLIGLQTPRPWELSLQAQSLLPPWIVAGLAGLRGVGSHPIYIALVVWWFVWLPLAEENIERGRHTRPFEWPIAPLLFIVRPSILEFVLEMAREVKKRKMVRSLPAAALIIVGFLGFAKLQEKYPIIPKILLGIFTFVAVIPAIYFFPDFLRAARKTMLSWYSDLNQLWRSRGKIMRPQEFPAEFARLETRRARNVMLKRLERQELTRESAEWEVVLRRILAGDALLRSISRALPSGAVGVAVSSEGSLLEQRELVFTILDKIASPIA